MSETRWKASPYLLAMSASVPGSFRIATTISAVNRARPLALPCARTGQQRAPKLQFKNGTMDLAALPLDACAGVIA
jgi:hypothetical protein